MNNKERFERIITQPVPHTGPVPFIKDEDTLREVWSGDFSIVQHGSKFKLQCKADRQDGFDSPAVVEMAAEDALWIIETLKLGAFKFDDNLRRRVTWMEARG